MSNALAFVRPEQAEAPMETIDYRFAQLQILKQHLERQGLPYTVELVPDVEVEFGWTINGEDYYEALSPDDTEIVSTLGIMDALPSLDPDFIIDHLKGLPLEHNEMGRFIIQAIQAAGEESYGIFALILDDDGHLEKDAIERYGIERFLTSDPHTVFTYTVKGQPWYVIDYQE